MIELPVLYTKRADGGINQWTVSTKGDVVIMSYGKLGGKMTETRTRALPTNLGRANQRLGPEQACFEARAAWQQKRDTGYFETITDAETETVFLPMLAHGCFIERKRKDGVEKILRDIEYPCSAQRKLNGLRCLATYDRLISRENETWNVPHVSAEVRKLIKPGEFLDGEIYIHGMPLQEINSLVKNYRAPESLALEYHLYDSPDNRGTCWAQRNTRLRETYREYVRSSESSFSQTIRLEQSFEIKSFEELQALERIVVEVEGYEGLIVRQNDRPYRFNTRCDSILKWKRYHDQEFEIVDVLGRELIKPSGSLQICDKFVCRNNTSDATFEVVPKGTEAQRAEYLRDKEGFVGKRLTVRYFERSKDGIPQGNPVGLGVRLEEDMPSEENEEWA